MALGSKVTTIKALYNLAPRFLYGRKVVYCYNYSLEFLCICMKVRLVSKLQVYSSEV